MPDIVSLGYADSVDRVNAHHVRTWLRGEIKALKMSISSGPKDYVSNDIFTAFENRPGSDLIAMFVARGKPFLVYRMPDQRWFDASGKEVVGVAL